MGGGRDMGEREGHGRGGGKREDRGRDKGRRRKAQPDRVVVQEKPLGEGKEGRKRSG